MKIPNQEYELKVGPPGNFSFKLAEIWEYRELLYFFVWRDVKVKYKQTALGLLWVIIQPMLTVAIFSIFFGATLRIPTSGIPYPIFVLSGLIFWSAFSASLTNAGNSMLTNSNVIRKIYFPRIIIPLSSMFVAFVDLGIGLILFIVALLFFTSGTSLEVAWFMFIPSTLAALLVMILSTTGLSCLFASLNVKYRDFRYVVPFGLQVMMFLTPVIYPISILNYPGLEFALALNPMYAVIGLFRYPLTGQIDLPLLLISLSTTGVFFIWGLYYFTRTEYFFADLA